MQIKSQSSVCDLRIDPQKNLSVLQAVSTRRAGRLDTKEWEMQDTWDQNLPKLSKDLLMFAIGEKPFELKKLNLHPAQRVRCFLSSTVDSQL